ncbi:hypothetical protein [uncultured Paludibaculum sp.]|uniref:hypothetical protein n=1 Tax=uncultured Paludibaculum sp. TaxID=1765020 RepID=UPI002AAAE588|nr:hypothetical protein [uncultured Paludibaculum sp.]
MKAILSGQAGVVVVQDGSTCWSRRVRDDQYNECRLEDIPFLFADCYDLMSVASTSPAQAFRVLENEWTHDRALQLVLILLDSDAHLRARNMAASGLEKLFSKETAQQFVLHRLYAYPLPKGADLIGALEFCARESCRIARDLLFTLRDDQQNIVAVREHWNRLSPELFSTSSEKSLLEQIAIEEGFFYGLSSSKSRLLGEMISQWVSNPRLRGFGNRKYIIEIWAKPFLSRPKEPTREQQLDLFKEGTQGN